MPAANVSVPVGLPIAQLLVGSNYYFRIVVSNCFGLTAGATQSFATAGYGSTNVVTNLNDSGPGSLRQALLNADASAGESYVDATGITGVINLASALPVITNSTIIQGPGAAQLAIDGGSICRVFFIDVSNGEVNIGNVTLAHGHALGGTGGNRGGGGAGIGGALFVNNGAVTVSGVTFSGRRRRRWCRRRGNRRNFWRWRWRFRRQRRQWW